MNPVHPTTVSARFMAGLLLAGLLLGVGCRPAETGMTYSASNDAINLTVTLNTNQAPVGDLLLAELRIRHPVGSRLDLTGLQTHSNIRILAMTPRPVEIKAGIALSRYDLDFTALDLGQYPLTTGSLVCVLANNTHQSVPFPQIMIESRLWDVTDPLAWPPRVPRWPFMLAGAALLLALVFWLIKRLWRHRAALIPRAAPIPAHVAALRALLRLRERHYIEEGKAEPFYIELSGIVRHYLEDRFKLHAPERTTEEFIHEAAQSSALTVPQRALTRDFLEQSDLVKFARHQPARTDMQAAYSAAETLVQETAPREEAPKP